MGVRNMQGTPAHIEQLRRKEGEARRYKGRCHHYIDATGQCKLKNCKCGGSAHCDEYSRMSDKDFREKQVNLRKRGVSGGRKRTGSNASSSSIVNDLREPIKYGGETYYYSNGRWLDSSFCYVPDELGRKLASEFEKGRYFYKNTKPVRVRYSIGENANKDPEEAERKKAYVKTPSFARGKVDINELADSDKITLARYFCVSSSAYRTDEIEVLGLPSRVANRFPHYNIYTVEDLLKLTWAQVLQIRNVGEKNRQTIEDNVRRFLETKKLAKATKTSHKEPSVTAREPEIKNEMHSSREVKHEEIEIIETVPIDFFQIEDGENEGFYEEEQEKANGTCNNERENETVMKNSIAIDVILAVIIIGAILLFLWALKIGYLLF